MKSNCRELRAFTKVCVTCATRMTRGTCVFVKRLELRALKNACTKLFIICQSTDIDDLMAVNMIQQLDTEVKELVSECEHLVADMDEFKSTYNNINLSNTKVVVF